MRDKNYIKHFIIIGGGTFINLLLGLITTPLITRLVDPVEYGQLSIFMMYANMALIIFLLGMDQAVIRYYYEKDSTEYRRSLLFRCVKIPVAVTMIVACIIIFTSYTNIIKYEFPPVIMTLLCFFTLFEVVYRFSLNLLRLEYKTKMYSALNIIQKISYVVIVIPLLLMTKDNNVLILTFSTVTSVFICLIISIINQKNMWSIKYNNDQACHIPMTELINYSFPLIISMGITTLFQAIDKMSLNIYCSYTEVGIYSSTMTLVNIFAILQTTFRTLWIPIATEHYTKDKQDRLFYQKGNQIITVIMFFAGLCLILGKDVFALLLGEKYREAAYILPFLIFHPIMYTISETTVMGISFMKKNKMQILIAAIACGTNVIGNTILVPKLGCQGAAISTGISYIVFFSMRTIISNYYFYVDFKLKRFYIVTIAVCAYAFYNTFVYFNIGSIIGFLICVGVLVLLYKEIIVWGISHGIQYIQKKMSK